MKQNVHVKFHSEALLEELEARQLFSGGIEGILVENNEAEAAVYMDVSVESDLIESPGSIAEITENSIRQELVFIDTDVDNYQELLNDILAQGDEERHVEVILLDNDSDGIEQITEALTDYQNLDAVHLISHGSDGSVDIGNSQLDYDSLTQNLLGISGWGDAFSQEGDFLIYGCNLAETEDGQSLIQALSTLTLTDVAASDDLTGQAELGGDWELEIQTGNIETLIAISTDAQQNYQSVLAVETVRDNFDSDSYSNNDGSQSWTSDWQEIGENDGENAGRVIVDSDALHIYGNSGGSPLDGVQRVANLSGATSATLSFDYNNIQGNGSKYFVEISTDNSSWTTLYQYNFIGSGSGSESVDISAYIDSTTYVRFVQTQSGNNADNIFFDNIEIDYIAVNDFIVTTAADSGAGSLRQAIIDANANAGTDTITFNIGADGSQQTINLLTALDPITDTIIIDGFSQYGALTPTTPIIEINGAATTGVDGIVLSAGSGGSTIQGLIINNFDDDGIDIESANNTIIGNWIGLDNTGTSASANGGEGLEISTSGNVIGGTTAAERNVISGNGLRGVYLNGSVASNNIIQGNYIGTNATGTAAVGNGTGIIVNVGASNNTIGGATVGAGNVISGNTSDGLRIRDTGSSGNLVQGNIIGLDATGTSSLGNGDDGVEIDAGAANNIIGGSTAAERNIISGNLDQGVQLSDSGTEGNTVSGNYIGTDITGTIGLGNTNDGILINLTASNNTIGGLTAGERNILSGNGSKGIALDGSGTANNMILGNYIGVDITGAVGLGNSSDGIKIGGGATANTIGGTTTGAANIIGGNGQYGIFLENSGTDNNTIQGNFIGTDATGTVDLGNPRGITIYGGASNNLIGGTATGAGNTIAFSGSDGITINISTTTGNSVLGNSIYSNGDLGIDLNSDNLTSNDTGDADTGANNLQNYPILTTAETDGISSIEIGGTFNSTANTTFRIEIFSNSVDDGSGYGEGETYLGFVNVTTDGSGNATYSATLSSVVNVGAYISATATNLTTNDTSEFSQNVQAQLTNDAPTFLVGDGIVTTVTGAGDEIAYSTVIQPDGKIVVAGQSFNGVNSDISLLRYNVDGTLDTSFGGGDGIVATDISGTTDAAYVVTLQADGKILLAGTSHNGANYDFAVLRYNSDGTLDTSFGGGDGIVTTPIGTGGDHAFGITVQDDQKILVSGYSNSATYDFSLVRYNTDGTLDTSFGGGDGIVITDVGGLNDYGNQVAVQTDGKILVSGRSENGSNLDFALTRYNSDGSLDTSFGGGDGIVTVDFGNGHDFGTSLSILPSGKIIVAGQASNGSNYDFAIAQFNSDGSLDTGFGGGDGLVTTAIGSGDDKGLNLTVQTDGKILVSGSSDNGVDNDFALVRYLSDGSLDTSFGGGDGIITTAIGSALDIALGVTVQDDGEIVVVGYTNNGADNDIAIARYNTDGTLNESFGTVVNTLDATPIFTEDGAAVVLDADVQIFDEELNAADNYSGASLTLVRNGGANADDVYSATGNLAVLTESGNLDLSGVTIGTVTTNSAGTFVLAFNANATQARVNETLQSIAYSNSSDNPPASAQIDWAFNDGNSGAQGSGGALETTGSTTISITAVNYAPIATNSSVTGAEDTNYVFVWSDFNITDVDTDISGSTATQITSLPVTGALEYFNGSVWVTVSVDQVITKDSVDSGNLRFVPLADESGNNYTQFNYAPVQTDVYVTLNSGATTDGVLILDSTGANPELLGGASTLSITVSIDNATTPSSAGLFSYASAAAANGNEVLLLPKADGDINVVVGGTGQTLSTGIDFYDGSPHTITLNWDGSDGSGELIVDGNSFAFTGATGTIEADGVLMIGQEQDDVGVLKTDQPFIGDITHISITTDGTLVADYDMTTDGSVIYDTVGTLDLTIGGDAILNEVSTGNAVTMTVDITPINDAPSGADKTVTTNEDSDYVFTTTDFGFTDVETDVLLNVIIASAPTNGTLYLDANLDGVIDVGEALIATDVIAVADITAGKLKFQPATDANGTGYDSFTFQVQDDGGVANGGVDTDQSANTITIDVTAVNDAPLATNLSAAEGYTEDTALNLTDIVISDVDSANATVSLTLSDTSAGSLNTATSGAVTSTFVGGVWTASGATADVNALLAGVSFNPALNYNSNFNILTSVDDGVAPALTGTKVITATAVNDAPLATNLSAAESYTEDSALNLTDIVISDVDSANATVTLTLSDVAAGSLSTASSGAVTSTFIGGVWTASGAIADINTLLAGVTFTPTLNYDSDFTIATSVDDGVAAAVTGTKVMTATAVNDAPTFGLGDGKVTTAIGSGHDIGKNVTVQSDGKVLVSGYSSNGSDWDFALTRYNTDGTLDTSFGGGDGIVTTDVGGNTDRATSIILQPDGKILLIGNSYDGSNYYDFALTRYNTDGTLDTSFGGGDGMVTTDVFGFNDFGMSVDMQTDGKIVIAGYSYNGSDYDFSLMRYNIDGSLDTSFGGGDGIVTTDLGSGNDYSSSVTVQTDGKILIAGESYDGSSYDFTLARYNSNGTLDTSFGGGDGIVTTDTAALSYVSSTTVQTDGKILTTGYSDNGSGYGFSLTRYNADGSLDTSFGGGDGIVTTAVGSSTFSLGESATLQTDGKILVTGYTLNGADYDFALIRYNSDGTLDTSFGGGDGIVSTDVGSDDDKGYSVTVQTDGKILVAGESRNASNDDFALVRYNTDGSLDTTFDINILNASPTFTEDGAAIVLDADVQIFDQELNAADNYSGSTLTLVRNGGTSTEDVFSATGNLATLTEAGNLNLSGVIIGTVTTNSAGTLVLTFNANATQDRVNETLQSIAYSNNSDTPPASAQIDWIFNDGNSGAQGSGGALEATGSTTVNIIAVNDAATATNLSAAESYTEDSALNLSNIDVSDVDSANATVTLTLSDTGAGSLNTATSGAVTSTFVGGVWTATGAIADINTLLAGVTFTPTTDYNSNFSIATSVDDDGVAVAVTGTKVMTATAVNDAATATNLSAAESYTEDTALNLTDIVVSDVDSAIATVILTLSDTGAGSLNTATSGAVTSTFVGGVWTATGAIADINTLLVGVTFTPTLNYDSNFTIATSVEDGVAAAVTGTKVMTGSAVNDAAVIAGVDTGTVQEDVSVVSNNISTTGLLTITDVDTGESTFQAETITGTYGDLVMQADGNWTYSADNTQGAIQALDSGESLTDTLTVTSFDGTTHNVVITINGTDDISTIGGTTTGTVTEDGTLTSTGALTISDTDTSDSTNFVNVATTASDNGYGTFEITGNIWTFTLDNANAAVQGLDVGETLSDTYTFTAPDGETQEVTVTINGAEDTPTIDSTAITASTEDVAYSYTITTTDVDVEAVTITATTLPAWLTLTDNGDGTATLSGTPLNANVGNNNVVLNVSDGTLNSNQSFSITVANTNDAAVIAGVASGTVQEDVSVVTNNISTTGLLTITDDDIGESSFQAATITGTYGSLTLDTAGNWTYTADNTQTALQQLDAGESLTDTLVVLAFDGTAHNVVITIDGTDDVSVIGGTIIGSVTEDGTLTSTGALTITDTDTSDPTNFVNVAPQSSDNGYGTFEITANTWTFTLNNAHAAVQALDSGESLTDTYTFNAPDGESQQVTVTINGAEDTPVFDSTAVIIAIEDAAYSYTITTSDVDVENVTITASTLPAWLTLIDNGDGTATLSGTPSNANVGNNNVVLNVSDGTLNSNQSFTIAVSNINDAPTLDLDANDSSGSVGANYSTSYSEGSAAVNITDSDALLSDIDSTNLSSLTVTLTNALDGVDENFNWNVAGTSIAGVENWDIGLGTVTLTLTGSDTVANYQQVLQSITYQTTSEAPNTTDRNITIVVNDGSIDSNIGITTVTVNSVNDAAVITNGQTYSIAESAINTTLVGSVLATDVDAGTLQNWTITAGNTDNIFAINPATGEMTVTDNSNLDFDTTASYTLSLTVSDGTNTSAVETVTINVTDVAMAITAGQSFNVSETAIDNTVVGSVSTTGDSPALFSITGGNIGSAFAIDNSGNITIADSSAIDYESLINYTLTIQASDGTTLVSDTVSVTVTDDVEVVAYTIDAIADTSVAENTAFTSVTPALSGATPIGSVTYTLTGSDAALFTVNSSTGVVTMIARDYESSADTNTDNIYDVTLVATDDDGNTDSEAFTVSVTDIDEFDVITPIDNDGTINIVAENSATNTVVGVTALASDADLSTNTITYSLIDNAGGRFQIDNNTGVVSVADGSLLNAETASSHEITIQVTSTDGSVATELFSITVADVNEFRVGSVIDSDDTLNTLAESASVGDTVGITASAGDADLTTNAITYSLTDNADDLFAIDASTGIVTVASALDYEMSHSHNITVLASSNDGSTSQQVFTITVSDINETAIGAITDSNAIADSVVVNASLGDTVGITALAIDADSIDNVSYSLSDDAGGLFIIDGQTGIVTVNAVLDAETATSYTITVLATSSDTSTSSQSYTITVRGIGDFNDSTLTDSNDAANLVTENAENGTVVGITALRSDLEQSNITVSYSLIDNAGGRFSIDKDSGIVTVTDSSLLNVNIATSHSITIQASASDGSVEIRNFTIKVIAEKSITGNDNENIFNPPVLIDNLNLDQDFDDKDTNNRNIDITSTGNIQTDESETRLQAKKPPLSESSDINSRVFNKDELTIEYTEQQSDGMTITKTKSNFVQRTGSQINDLNKVDNEFNTEISLFELTFSHSNENLWKNIDLIREQMDAEKDLLDQQDVEIEFVAGATISITAGFVSWVLRGGALLSSLLSSVSLFKQFDPLAVVFKDTKKEGKAKTTNQKNKQDKVETMFDKHSKK